MSTGPAASEPPRRHGCRVWKLGWRTDNVSDGSTQIAAYVEQGARRYSAGQASLVCWVGLRGHIPATPVSGSQL
jgi:hypothetical protein